MADIPTSSGEFERIFFLHGLFVSTLRLFARVCDMTP
jgi:hypothetical protein